MHDLKRKLGIRNSDELLICEESKTMVENGFSNVKNLIRVMGHMETKIARNPLPGHKRPIKTRENLITNYI
jgi:hypothetical protein